MGVILICPRQYTAVFHSLNPCDAIPNVVQRGPLSWMIDDSESETGPKLRKLLFGQSAFAKYFAAKLIGAYGTPSVTMRKPLF
eukprot:gene5744-6035_t